MRKRRREEEGEEGEGRGGEGGGGRRRGGEGGGGGGERGGAKADRHEKKGEMRTTYELQTEEVGHGHMTVHVIKSYVWESHMKPFSHRVAA